MSEPHVPADGEQPAGGQAAPPAEPVEPVDPVEPAQPAQPALLGLDEVAAAPAAPAAPAARGRRRAPLGAQEIAEELPVARVVLDLAPHHLDRPYDYLVPAADAATAQPGVRVKVRFGPQEVDGFVVERRATSDHEGRLLPLRRVVSGEQVLAPEVLALCRAVADRYAGTLADVLRLAVPPRHARVEQEGAAPADVAATPPEGTDVRASGASAGASAGVPVGAPAPAAHAAGLPAPPAAPVTSPWAPYRGGEAFLRHLLAGGAPRAVWTPLPGLAPALPRDPSSPSSGAAPVPHVPHWADAVAHAVRAVVAGGRGAVVVVPDARDVDRVTEALDDAGLAPAPGGRGTAVRDAGRAVGRYVRLTADEGPAPRYRAFLAARRGTAQVVVGTRAAAFAPVRDLGLVVLWGDGEDTLAEPRAPYPHAREVLALRSEAEDAGYLLGSPGRTVQAQALVASGWAHEVAAPREVLRARSPRVRALTSVELAAEGPGAAARLPSAAWRAARDALARGPVLVQVPRGGYLPVVACARCRTAARCTECHGPLGVPRPGAAPQCAWCGRLAGGWSCTECGWTGLRSVRVGTDRTAEELGRAFPGTTVRVSAASAPGGVTSRVGPRPALVVATPGAEPVADGGYAAALLLDAAVATAGIGLAVATDALHRWLAATALVRPAADGGQVLLVGDAAPGPTGALVRVDPAGLAERELAERRELDLPPAVRVAAVTGDRAAVAALVDRVPLAGPDTVLGPVELADHELERVTDRRAAGVAPPVRTVLRVPLREGRRLAEQLSASLAVRSARREGGTVRVQLDPKEML